MTFFKYFASLALIAIASQSLLAGDPGFSLHNKSKKAIGVKIENAGAETSDNVRSGDFKDRAINITSQTILTLWNADNPDVIIFRATFPNGKTIYVNWDESHKPPLYHQRGRLLGITGKTDRGYSTKNNVKDEEIVKLAAVKPEPVPPVVDPCIDIKKEFGEGTAGFKKAALLYHPDRCASGDNPRGSKEFCEEKFKVIGKCYGK